MREGVACSVDSCVSDLVKDLLFFRKCSASSSRIGPCSNAHDTYFSNLDSASAWRAESRKDRASRCKSSTNVKISVIGRVDELN